MPRPFVSLCLIVRDEERTIERCLSAGRNVADEIVVVDTGSGDRTIEIATALGARVFRHPWSDDFAAARNAAIDRARGDWVLFVDADEILEPVAPGPFRQRLHDTSGPAFTVEVVSDRGEGRIETALVTRLFRNRPEHRYEGRVHEQVLGTICRGLGVEVFTPPPSGLRLAHEGYLPERRVERAKEERNRRLLTMEVADRPDDPGPRFLLAKESTPGAGGDLLDVPAAHDALAVLAPAADHLSGAAPRGITEPALALAARLALVTGDFERAARWSEALRAQAGPTARWCFVEGERRLTLAARGRAEAREAAGLFEMAGSAPEGSTALPAEPLLRGGWASARREAARRLADAGSRIVWPETVPASERALVDAFGAARSGEPVLALLLAAARTEPGDPRLWWAMARQLLHEGQPEAAARALAAAGRAAPGWSALDISDDGCLTPPHAGLLALWLSDSRT